MKRILSIALAIFLTGSAVEAQKNRGDKQRHHKHQKEMALKNLDLSADQQSRIKGINEKYRMQASELKKQDQLTVREMKSRRESLHKQHKADIQSVLTNAQKEQLTKMKKERNGKMAKGRKQNVEAFQKDLNLSADQKAKLAKMREETKAKAEAIKTDGSLSREQKKERFHELMKKQHEQMKSVLTKEQVEKIQSTRKERSSRNTR